VAKQQGIYGNWGFYRFYAYVKTTTHFSNRHDYLAGMILSLFMLPILWSTAGETLFCLGLASWFLLGLVDLADFYFFNRIKRTGRWDIMDKITEHFIFGVLKVGFLSTILFLVFFVSIYVGFPTLIKNHLFLMAIAITCIAISLKVTKWTSKLTEITSPLS
jgi:uncharacterized metal-binding protein